MKKNRPIPNILFQIMKITFIQAVLAILFTGFAFANHSYAQPELNQKVSLRVDNKQLKKSIKRYRKYCEGFFYLCSASNPIR